MDYKSKIITTIGEMLAVFSSENLLRALNFSDISSSHANVPYSSNEYTDFLEKEMNQYFSGDLKEFKTTLLVEGTDFRIKVLKELIKIPYGKTISYSDQATRLCLPNAYRAVANENSKNKIAIIIPCHRVISKTGALSGYNGGVEKKKWLLEHERRNNKHA